MDENHQTFDDVAEVYDATRSLKPEVMEQVLDVLVEQLPSEEPILDIGCGTGRFLVPLQGRGYDVYGIDISEEMMAKAKQKGVRNVCYGDALDIPHPDGKFHTAMSVHLMHLIGNWKGMLKEICRTTREQYLSVVKGPKFPPYMDIYAEEARARGHPEVVMGILENQLSERIEPAKVILVDHMVEHFDTAEKLKLTRDKKLSVTWHVPDEVNTDIADSLEKTFPDKEIIWEYDLSIMVWNVADIRAWLEKN